MATISYPNNGLTNKEVLEYLALPESIITDLQSNEQTTYEAASNEFINAMVNKICYQVVDSFDFSNPFEKYWGFPVEFGDTIENLAVELPKGYVYDRENGDPFARKNTGVKSLYASINYKMQYETTIYRDDLKHATLNQYGFMNVINTILSAMGTAMAVDKYHAVLTLLGTSDIYANGTEELIYEKDATKEQKADLMVDTIVNASSQMQIMMTSQNKMKYTTATPKPRLMLIIKYGLYNSINLDYLKGVYNLSKVDLVSNIVQVDGFKVAKRNANGELVVDAQGAPVLTNSDIDFVLIDTSGFDFHNALQGSGSAYTPRGRYTNYFTDSWDIISFKTWFNARAFKLKAKE